MPLHDVGSEWLTGLVATSKYVTVSGVAAAIAC